jgi:hypothetical protein
MSEKPMRYFVTTPNGEQGPYEEDVLRGWLRDGAMPTDAPVRPELGTMSQPASSVFPGDVPRPFGGAPGFGPAQPSFGASPANMYAPPTYTGGASDGWVHVNQGSLALGVVCGFLCSCIALIVALVSSSMGSETKRGIYIGFGIKIAIAVIVNLIAAAGR